MRSLILALLIFGLADSMPAIEPPVLPVENGDFEHGIDPWKVRRGEIRVVPEAAHDSAAGLRIVARENAGVIHPAIPIEPGKTYVLRFWVRGLEFSYAAAILGFTVGGSRHLEIENPNAFKPALPYGKEWQPFTFKFTPPDAASEMSLQIAVWPKKDVKGTDVIDIDGIVIEEAAPTP
ncbi:hypothetical protein BH09VER1_BH09VER1_42940 [soil metagenome]